MKSDDWCALIFVAVLLGGATLGGLALYAKISTCGWKGLFVECRIMDCPRAN